MMSLGRRGRKRKTEDEEEKQKPAKAAKEEAVPMLQVYGRNAEGVKAALLAARPELTVVLNPEKPRRNSFEITLIEGETPLWTGIKKGPPRKLKFPEPDVVVSALLEAVGAD
uniref:Selenoprotein H n=1 Tax=Hippocampus comes TaxID=109280 RepID=A0A3Q2XUL7_HIPCM